jgi:hypothetical protein
VIGPHKRRHERDRRLPRREVASSAAPERTTADKTAAPHNLTALRLRPLRGI